MLEGHAQTLQLVDELFCTANAFTYCNELIRGLEGTRLENEPE